MKTVKLLGIDWLTENLKDKQGSQHFTHEEALRLAESQGFRLPTRQELELLRNLPSIWDEYLKGRWFAENKKDLKSPDKSLFLPASGCRYGDASLHYVGSNGYYWSSTVFGFNSYNLYFYGGNVNPANYNYSGYGFSVRCVEE